MLKKMGILTSYVSPMRKGLNPAFHDPEGYWTGSAARARVIPYNTRMISRDSAPHSIFELVDEKWRGRVAKGRTKRNRAEKDKKIDAILADLGLPMDRKRYPHTLSGGEKQRLALGRAIAQEPDYLLMDEPFSQTDEILKKDLIGRILQLKKDTGIVYVTHQINEAMALADNIAILSRGTIARTWTKKQISCISYDDILQCLR